MIHLYQQIPKVSQFLARLYKCTTPGVGVGVGRGSGMDKMLKFYVKVFLKVVGKALSGKLSCMLTGLRTLANTHIFTLRLLNKFIKKSSTFPVVPQPEKP